ncbi:MAG: hypothetical protein MUO92_04125, partial [Dehalococcoidales bacterium]|nr:hypothetical protein [Dehalococcoidales bacterium]
PMDINIKEFEEKVILNHINIENYDLLIGNNLARNVLSEIVKLQPEIAVLKDVALLDCDLSDSDLTESIVKVYQSLYSINGLWLTGVSKIAHLLNNNLFALLNLDISDHFKLLEGTTSLVQWLKITQQNMQEVTVDFKKQGFPGSPEQFLSGKLEYNEHGFQTSLVKFLDEYFWISFGDNLPVPPRWIPPLTVEKE